MEYFEKIKEIAIYEAETFDMFSTSDKIKHEIPYCFRMKLLNLLTYFNPN